MIMLFLLVAVFLLFLNGFFVLAEFAAVKMRPTRIEELARSGDRRAQAMRHIQSHLDEYLSVCQVGITLASIGLGFVGEPSFARLIEPAVQWTGAASTTVAHTIAVTAAYLAVSFLHIVIGELVPKSMAIRGAEGAARFTARPLRLFHFLFYVPLVVLNGSANIVLRLMGYPRKPLESEHTQEELKIILAGSQRKGLISFRRLLLLENIFDLADLKVRHVMRPRKDVKTIPTGMRWEEVGRIFLESRFSRFPVVTPAGDVIGLLHVKDVLHEIARGRPPADVARAARPALHVRDDTLLEEVLTELQRGRSHAALVQDAHGHWVGYITLEDVLEEIVGAIEDEFEVEPQVFLADLLSRGRIVLGLQATEIPEAIRAAILRVNEKELPAPRERIVQLVLERESAMSTYLGQGVSVPHARIEGLPAATLIFARAEKGVPVADQNEKATLFFIVLTPAGAPREQVRLVARIARLLESEYTAQRLHQVGTSEEILEVMREGDPPRPALS